MVRKGDGVPLEPRSLMTPAVSPLQAGQAGRIRLPGEEDGFFVA